jgi:ABC-type transport system involved in multi-copper enzyme maturation permease subunit
MFFNASALPLGFLDSLRILPQFIVNWLTPLSLMGLGVLAGFVILLAMWAVGAALSMAPSLGRIAESSSLRWITLAILGGALLVVMTALSLPRFAGWFAEGAVVGLRNTALTVLFLIPLAAAIGMAIITLISRRTVTEIPLALREGVLFHISIVLSIVAAVGLLSPILIEDPGEVIASLARLPYVGETKETIELPAPKLGEAPPEKKHVVDAVAAEVVRMSFSTNQPLEVSTESAAASRTDDIRFPGAPVPREFSMDVKADERVHWLRGSPTSAPLPEGKLESLYIRNVGEGPATLELTIITEPTFPQAEIIPITALCVVMLYLIYLVQRSWMPRLSAVSLATSISELAQPMFLILVGIGVFLLLFFLFLPFHTFGEDIKMLKNTGLQLVLVLCIIQAVWAAGTSVSEEIEGRTALTVLSKPINRIQFIIGKFLGIVWTVGLMFLILGTVFLFVVSYKVVYDGRASAVNEVEWQDCFFEMTRIVPGLALAFMETVVLTAISVAISTRLSMLANFSISFGIYVLGHLTPLIVQSSVADFEPVKFVGQLIATVIPVLEHFNIEAAVSGGTGVPLEYLGWALLYCMMYVTLAMLLALVLFEDRDVA